MRKTRIFPWLRELRYLSLWGVRFERRGFSRAVSAAKIRGGFSRWGNCAVEKDFFRSLLGAMWKFAARSM
jgi:hypothetical protein